MFECHNHLGCVESGLVFIKPLFPAEKVEELTSYKSLNIHFLALNLENLNSRLTMAILKHEVQFFFVLETRVELDYERVVDVDQDVSLDLHVGFLLSLLYFLLFEYFHGVECSSVDVLYQEDFCIRTFAYH